MKITDAALMNFLWAWEVMRRLGFEPRELFMTVVPPGGRPHMPWEAPSAHYVRRPCRACGSADLRSVRVRAPGGL